MTPLWPHGDPRDVARSVLSQPKFRDAVPRTPVQSWWERFWNAVGDWFNGLFHPLTNLHGGESLARSVALIVLIVVLAGLGWIAWRFAPGLFGGITRTRRAASAGIVFEELGTAAELRARAAAAEAAGRYREAATLLWTSLLHAFDERGRAQYDSARTPGEWRRLVRDRGFDTIARDATVALFADEPIDAARVARMRERYDELLTA